MTTHQETMERMKEAATNAPEVEIVRDRYGYRIDGQFYRRVTTLCGGIPKPWLGGWAAKEVASFAVEHRESWERLPKTDAVKLLKGAPWSKRDDAGDRGTAVHNTLEALVRGEPMPDDLSTEDELDCAIAAEAFLAARKSRVLASEMTVFHAGIGYAGTFDLWDLDAGGVSWLLDWKTSSGVYPEYAIQLTAYRNAEFAVVHKVPTGDGKWTGKVVPWSSGNVDRLGVVHVRPDGATLHPIRYSNRLWTVFRAAAHVKMWQLDTNSAFGKTPREAVFSDSTLEVTTKEEAVA